jgi:hypothetical protein
MPEDLITYLKRLAEFSKKQIECVDKALENNEFDTADFCAANALNTLMRIRSTIVNQLRFSKEVK